MRRATITRIRTALDTGGGFTTELAELETLGVTVPGALSRSADHGVATLTDLQTSFPAAARAALDAARAEAAKNGETGGFTAFLRTQLGARSLEPREGDDPDAVLSRAEAALREGRLNDVLAEVETLPELGRAEMSAWSGQVARRIEALAAAQTLSDDLN